MARIHIDVRDDIPFVTALECVRRVVAEGRVSNHGKMFCYGMSFLTEDGVVWVQTREYRKSDCFMVYKDKESKQDDDDQE